MGWEGGGGGGGENSDIWGGKVTILMCVIDLLPH